MVSSCLNYLGYDNPPLATAKLCGEVYDLLCALAQIFIGCGGIALDYIEDVCRLLCHQRL